MVCHKISKCFSTSEFSKRQILTLFVFGMAYLFSACVTSLQAPFYPAEAEKKNATATEYGLVFGVFQLIVFIVSPIFGKYMNKFGAKLIFNVGILTTGISCFLFGFLDNVNDHFSFITLSFIIRISEAIGSAGFVTAAFTIISGEFPDSIATTFASLETFYGLGLIIGPSIGGALYELGGFKLPFIATGICLAIVALITPLLLPNGDSMDGGNCKETDGFGLLSILRIPAVSIAAICIWMSSNSIGVLNACLEHHLRQFDFSKIQIGLVFMITGGSYAIAAPIWGKLMDKNCHPKSVALYGCVLIIFAHVLIGPVAFLPFDTVFEVSCIGLILHGVGVGAIQVSGFILALRESIANGFPDNLATYSVVSGLWASALALGLFIGPSIGGYLLDLTNGDYGKVSLYPFIASLLTLIVVIGFIYADRQTKEKQTTDKHSNSNESTRLLVPSSGSILKENTRKISHEYRGTFVPTNYGIVTEVQ